MTFGSLARRLTAWYVVVAVLLVVLLAGAVIVTGLSFYARDVSEQVKTVSRQIPEVEARARADRDDWKTAVALLQRRLARPGLIIVANEPPTPSRPPEPPRYRPFFGNRIGFAAASFFGIHLARTPFFGGVAIVFADVQRLGNIVAVAFGVLTFLGLIAGLVAWGIGRYITLQAMRPLYDVTSALVRFAGRDFSAQPIDVAGRSEFDALVRAYNAAAAQVESAFEERAAAENQMRQFVADAGHELRTPLTIVLGYIDMIKRRAPDDARSRRIFETIAIEGSRMRTLIDNLVLLARLEGADNRPVEPFELTPLLVDDIVATRSGIVPQVAFELAIDVDATIIGSRSEIYEAIANVVDNALKYAPGSPVAIAVKGAPGGVCIEISDRGPGIAAADRDAIFDRFYRGSTRGEVEGSGLGLPIAKRAVERAGGSLALVASSAQGSMFAISLRADRVRPHAAAPRLTA